MGQGLTHVRPVDPILTSFGLEYRQAQSNFVADVVAPWIQTPADSNTYYIADPLNNLKRENIEGAIGAASKMIDLRFTSASFLAKPFRAKTLVLDDERRNWMGGGAALDQRAVAALTDKAMLARENRVEALLDAIAPTTSLSSTARWDSTAPNPRADIRALSTAILKRIGRHANTVVITGAVWDSVVGTHSSGTAGALILDAIKYTQKGTGDAITPQLVAQYLNVDVVAPALAVQSDTTKYETTTVPGAAGLPEAGVYMFDQKECYVGYIDRNPTPQTVSAFLTFGPSKGQIKRWRSDDPDGDFIRIEDILVEKATCTSAMLTLGTVIS